MWHRKAQKDCIFCILILEMAFSRDAEFALERGGLIWVFSFIVLAHIKVEEKFLSLRAWLFVQNPLLYLNDSMLKKVQIKTVMV